MSLRRLTTRAVTRVGVMREYAAGNNSQLHSRPGHVWAATVISLSATTARVRFTEHKAADGRPYEDVRVAQTFVALRAD